MSSPPGRGLKRPITATPEQHQGHGGEAKRKRFEPYQSPRGIAAIGGALKAATNTVVKTLFSWGRGHRQGQGHHRQEVRLDSEGQERHLNGDMEDKDIYLKHDSTPSSKKVYGIQTSSSSSNSGPDGTNKGAKVRVGRNLDLVKFNSSNNNEESNQVNGDEDEVQILEGEATTTSTFSSSTSGSNLRFRTQMRRQGLACALDGQDEFLRRGGGGAVLIKTSAQRKENQGHSVILDRLRQKHPDTTNFVKNFHFPTEKGVTDRSQVGGIAQKVNRRANKEKMFFNTLPVSPNRTIQHRRQYLRDSRWFRDPSQPKDLATYRKLIKENKTQCVFSPGNPILGGAISRTQLNITQSKAKEDQMESSLSDKTRGNLVLKDKCKSKSSPIRSRIESPIAGATKIPELITLEDSSTDDECKAISATPSVPTERNQMQRRELFAQAQSGHGNRRPQADDDIQEILDKYVNKPFEQGTSKRESSSSKRANTLREENKLNKYTDPEFVADISKRYREKKKDIDRNIAIQKTRKDFYYEKNKRTEEALEKRIQKHLSITHVCLEETVEECEEEVTLPELTDDIEAVIEDAIRSPPGKVLVDMFRIPIERKDVTTLMGLNWLNDEVINFYMQMICERSKVNDNWPNVYAFNTFFYPKLMSGGHQVLKRWTKKVDVFSFDLILVPVHLGMHWCLSTIDLRSKTVRYYDSMGGDNRECLDALVGYLEKEHLDKKKTPYDTSGFGKVIVKDIPQQMNGSDCGMFTCKFAEYLSRDADITFTQEDMPYFRRRMVYEIVTNKIMHP